MRTTIDLDDDLLRDLKIRAAKERTTLGRLVNALLRSPARRKGRRRRLKLHTSGSGGLLPGVDVNNRAALLDYLDGVQ